MKVYYDFHIHSALSPCGDTDNTLNNIVNMAKLKGLDAIAITDHNSILNCRNAIILGEAQGLTVLAGMELTTAEDIHILCLFPSLESAESFYHVVDSRRTVVPNRADIFGEQQILGLEDEVLGMETRLLIVATELTSYEVPTLVEDLGGVAIPAHLDKESNSLVSILGGIYPDMGFKALELSPKCPESTVDHYMCEGYTILRNSDAHYLENISERQNWLELPDSKPSTIINYLKNQNSR